MLNLPYFLLILVVICIGSVTGLVYENHPKELLNWCIDARHHKIRPGPADDLHGQCKPWEKRSCCTKETTVSAHIENMYNFDWDHCSHVKPMSANCRRHFVQDLCFYECSPNTGPWVVKESGRKIRRERFFDIPLCASECEAWFNDCANEYTCTDNWARNFNWDTGRNTCPKGTSCRSYRAIFGTPENFCERIWDHSWKVTNDSEPCMKLWFNGANPNDDVARQKLEWIIRTHRMKDFELTSSFSIVAQIPVITLILSMISLITLNYCY